GLGGGLLGYQTSRGLEDRRAEEAQQRKMRDLQIQQMSGNLEQEQKIRAHAPQYQMPGNLTPNDDEGNAMPPAPQGMNWGGYTNAVTGIDPMKGLAMQSQLAQMTAKERG